MPSNLHFISGLPRSGSTLLSALLRQNPHLHAGMSSPVGHLFATMMRAMSQEQAMSVFIDDDQRRRVLRGVVENYYSARIGTQVVFDTNRGWCARIPTLADLWPSAVVVALVRNPAWVLDSIERLTRRNALEPSGIFGYSTEGTVYSRAEALMSGTGMIGFSINALREALFDPHRGRLLLVRFETLTADPLRVLEAIYARIGERTFLHDPNNVEPDFEAIMFDARLGTAGLHSVRPKVCHLTRDTVLPPDLFAKYVSTAFWDADGALPHGVQII